MASFDDDKFFFMFPEEMYFPAPLKKGDKIALVSPASAVKDEYVYGAMERIMEYGYEPVLMPHALGYEDGSFSAPKAERLMDLLDALENQEFKAILCTRGGYGCCQLLANLSSGLISSNPKWLIGFSDVSALLAFWYGANIASIHGPMAKHLATLPKEDASTKALFDILANGGKFDYTVASNPQNFEGFASGILRGGNLAVLNDLGGTPEDILEIRPDDDVILFLEDINEPIYKVNRMLWRLMLNGTLWQIKGLIFGQFTDYKPDKNFNTMEEMIIQFLEYHVLPSYPVVFGFPTGHIDNNLPLVEGARVELTVTSSEVRLHTV